jgi:hypothetical protein
VHRPRRPHSVAGRIRAARPPRPGCPKCRNHTALPAPPVNTSVMRPTLEPPPGNRQCGEAAARVTESVSHWVTAPLACRPRPRSPCRPHLAEIGDGLGDRAPLPTHAASTRRSDESRCGQQYLIYRTAYQLRMTPLRPRFEGHPCPCRGARVVGTALIDTLPLVSHRTKLPAS